MLGAAVYARFSSDLQRTTSIEDQIRVCRDAASRFGCVVLNAHVYADEELSGATDHRSGYQRLLVAAKTGAFQAIIVESQDRLWRNQGEMHHALERLAFWGVRVFSVATGGDLTDRMGRLLASVMGWKDEAFLADLRDKTRRGMAGQVRRGLSAGGRAYGYRSVPVQDETGRLVGYRRVIDPQEAVVVQRIFDLYDTGYSPKTIAHILNDERVPPPRPARGRRIMGWTWTTINGSPKKATGILNNPVYVGRVVWNRSQKVRDPDTGRRIMRPRPEQEWLSAEVPKLQIIPQNLWERVQTRRRGRRLVVRGNLRGRRPKHLFSGLLVCGECGSHYTIKSGDYYGCAAHTNRGPGICANGKQVRRDRLEEGVLGLIFDEVFSPDTVVYLTRKVNEAIERLSASPDESHRRQQTDLAQARAELENVKDAIRRGIVTPTTKGMLEECERRTAELETAARAEPPASAKVVALPHVVAAYLDDFRGTLGKDTDQARALLAKLIGHVTLRRRDDRLVAEVRGNLPGLLGLEDVCGKDGAGRGI